MTRNFKQPRRDDKRPYARRSSGRYEGEQTAGRARPRLNRESVDRAWENGARQQHHDYRPRGPRSNTRDTYTARNTQSRQQGQPYRANRRQYAPDESPSAPHGRSYQKPPFQRQENRRFDDRQPRRYQGSEREEGQYREPPRFTRERAYREQRPSSRERGYNTRSRPYPPRRSDARGGAQRRPDRFNREERSTGADRRTYQGEGRPETRSPRFQSRPERFSRSSPRPMPQTGEELFEGDYERFDADQHPPRGREPHMTRLPDGRVLKGNRREQREAAAFWTGVEDEAQELLQPVEHDENQHAAKEHAPAKRATTRNKAEGRAAKAQTPKTKTVKTAQAKGKRSAGTRSENRPKKTSARKKSEQAPESVSRPSKRGFKWPKPE